LNEISGVGFTAAWETRSEATVAGMKLPVIGFDCLLANERAAARPRDVGHIDALERLARRRRS
jgi:hypothetical protein